ncbi:MAG TPA: SUMF1/EgtB/PvdO family nonheme iron enzyme [Gemmatimonadales bacterium]|nr:SUMF1/EgtB/PvdO family nonheme iron enzyme [Gemmatimonadales bacterium]
MPGFERVALLGRLEAAWQRSDLIFDLLDPKALLVRPIALRQPFIFYVGHLAAFAWNQVIGGLLARASTHAELDQLFARGIDPVGVDAWKPEHAQQWPEYSDVLRYRDRVRLAIRRSFDDVEALVGSDVLAANGRVYQLVIEHELMHHETLLYMVQQLDRTLRRHPPRLPEPRFGGGATQGQVGIAGGRVVLGESFEQVPFGWDNEFPCIETEVDGFRMDRTAVRNGEWLEFLESGGYLRRELWDAEAWAWRERVGHTHPAFWSRDGERWMYHTLFDSFPLEEVADWPVYVSWAEADAYARWARAELPTEAEFHRAAEASGVAWGDSSRGNFDFTNWAPTPVGAYGGDGALDLVGNGWEWTRSRFRPFPGFTAWARTYPGYSADFFDDQHYVMLGASWATDRALVRRRFRNWFQPHYPYVFAKFRCVRR